MPFNVDTTQEAGPPAGTYYAEVAFAKETRSKKSGDGMFEIKFVALDRKKEALCTDYLMCEGKMAWAGIKKLRALGFDMSKPNVQVSASDLIGRRCYLHVASEEFQGRFSLKVVKMSNADVGYFPESAPPDGAKPPVAGKPKADHPFDDPFTTESGDDIAF